MKDVMILTGAGQIGMAIAPGIIVTPLAIDEFNGPAKKMLDSIG